MPYFLFYFWLSSLLATPTAQEHALQKRGAVCPKPCVCPTSRINGGLTTAPSFRAPLAFSRKSLAEKVGLGVAELADSDFLCVKLKYVSVRRISFNYERPCLV